LKILPIHQGSANWHAARAKYYRTASRAPIVMGASLYGTTRNDLMAEIKNGVTKEIDANTQALFDAGHAAENEARKIVEGFLKASLLPLTCLSDDEYLLASFDGINEKIRVGFEHKLANEKLLAQIRAKELDPFYYWQLEHEALVGNLGYIVFMCSDGTKERAAYLKYVPVPGRAEQLLAGWKQFDADLAGYQYVEVLPAAAAAPTMALPALSIQVNGSISLTDNLKVFGEKLTAFIAGLPEKPETDQEFADAEAAIKTLEKAQEALEAAEASALAQVATVDEMRRIVALYAGQARQTRLMLTKLVATRKETIRVEIVQAGKNALTAHVATLNKRLGKPYMPLIAENLAGVIKGKKTIASLHDAVDTEVARAKIELNETADRIEINLNCLRELAKDHTFLFADTAQIVLKANDDLTALVKLRISEHKAAEEKRLEAEREKIRAEEQAKAEAKAKEIAAAQAAIQVGPTEIPVSAATHQAAVPAAVVGNATPAPIAAPATVAPIDPAAELAEASAILLAFKDRFGRRKEFAGVTRAILDYFKAKQKKAA
jgi:hypothetical protein